MIHELQDRATGEEGIPEVLVFYLLHQHVLINGDRRRGARQYEMRRAG